MTVDVPYRAQVSQKSAPVRDVEAGPELGSDLAHSVDDLAPIAADTIQLTGQRVHDVHEIAERAAGGTDRGNRVREQQGVMLPDGRCKSRSKPGDKWHAISSAICRIPSQSKAARDGAARASLPGGCCLQRRLWRPAHDLCGAVPLAQSRGPADEVER